MLTLLFYEAATGEAPPTRASALAAALTAIPGVELAGADGDQYRPGQWRDAQTGATCSIDLGAPPLEDDPVHPPTAYDGWREVGLSIAVPLAGPHWLCVETLQLVEGLLARLPGLRTLDTEDTRRGQDDAGPAVWSRPRVLASWERLHAAQHEGRTDHWRMNRLASVCVWRYRRERARGQAAYPGLHWPETFALLDRARGQARSAAFWHNPAQALALPPVDLVIVGRGGEAGVMSAAQLAERGGATPLPLGQAAAVMPSPALAELHASAELQPAREFQALGDHDWSD